MSHLENLQGYRQTLDTIPDSVALAIGLRVFNPMDGETCVCGWVLREAIREEMGLTDAESVRLGVGGDVYSELESRFPAQKYPLSSDWYAIYSDILLPDYLPLIEEALFDRVMAAATRGEP